MSHALELTKANRLLLARAFRHNPRVDYSIDCVLEAQMGQAFVDDPDQPTAYRISIGPFWYFAGNAGGPGGRALLAEWPAYNLFMPSPPAWADAARETFGERLVEDYRLTAAMGVTVAIEYARDGVTSRWWSFGPTTLRRVLTACDDLQCAALWAN